MKAKETKPSQISKDKKLLELYENIENMLYEFEEYIEDSKKEMAEYCNRVELAVSKLTLIEKPEKIIINTGKKVIKEYQKQILKPIDEPSQDVIQDDPYKNMSKIDTIKNMLKDGHEPLNIAKKLNIGFGEVNLLSGIKK